MRSAHLLSVRVDATDYASATRQILEWAKDGSSRYVCHANVHMLMEAHDDPTFATVVNGADLVTADGMPLVWTLRAKGLDASRVYGPTLMLHLLDAAAAAQVPVALYGASDQTLSLLVARLRNRLPGLKLAFVRSPPVFGPGSPGIDEDDQALADSGARIVFVALGCPKQERWMAARRGQLAAVMVGVGAAFDFHAGAVRQAPEALRRLGLEWAFRAAMEPKRLLRRYARTNPRFVALMTRELLTEKLTR